ncbi:VWA domain-containing protein [Olavius algarvensis spirochete endosymbiont]|uniref:VWA domain-containing protein n=1 Tax=Olavius algarvensis spirochete endosymbiont TaxID=260710 RepID=UPI000F51A992|nr:VWA domain-containing protein [Olavius algarvensis spirochete endosymbiont]
MMGHKSHTLSIPCRLIILLIATFSVITQASANDLVILPGDVYIEITEDTAGFDLYIKAKEHLGSVLITESSADPGKKSDSFAFRAQSYNPVNGNERRILNGEFLDTGEKLFFLVDSTPESNELLGFAFKIHVPYQLAYGYPWSRQGKVEVGRGTWLNIRTFEKPFADYEGPWMDNPFVLSMKEIPLPTAVETEPASENEVGDIQEAVELIAELISSSGEEVDVVVVVDATDSMEDDLEYVKGNLVPLLRDKIGNIKSFRIGLVQYRDYKEAFVTRTSPFVQSLNEFQRELNRISALGGRDVPEAVDEGIYAGLTEYNWSAPKRMLIQLGDAPGHEEPLGAITPELVKNEASKLGVSIFSIQLPNSPKNP